MVAPSLYEPFGLVALEAAAVGGPLAVAATGGLAEIVRPGVTGLTCPAADDTALAEAVGRQLGDRGGALRMARAAERMVRRQFGWDCVAQRTSDVYARVWTNACLRANPSGKPMAGYGYSMMGPYPGGQAELLRVPWADFTLLALAPGTEHEYDFTMLSDVFPTGYHGAELAGVGPGSTVAVFGAGPVGLMAAHSSMLRGAARVFVVDKKPDRLALDFGATAVDYSQTNAVDVIADATDGAGVACGIEAVGYQDQDPEGEESPALALDNLAEVVRSTGRIGVVGVYNEEDPEAATKAAKEDRIGFEYGAVFAKNIAMSHGQCPVKRYNRQLRDLIIAGRAMPGIIVSHELALEQAPHAYQQFDKRAAGWTKVLLRPGQNG
jgi:glutathione-independent formaldehyde dehydrogenase